MLLATLGLIVAGPQLSGAGSPSEPVANKPRVDRLGDPLPKEVVARLGSSRMRHGDFRAILAFTADGKAIVSGSAGGLRIWDVATGKLRRRLPFALATDQCLDVACAANGITAASADEKTGIITVQRFDPADAKVLWWMEIPKRVRSSVPFLSRDGKRLAYVQDNKAVRIYDTIAEREIRRVPTQNRGALRLAFAPDDKTLAVSDGTDTVHLHDVTNGQSVRELKRDGDRIIFLVFSPDGRFLASLSDQRHDRLSPLDPVGVWDLTTGKQLHGFPSAGGILRPVFSPDGKYLALLGNHLNIVLWDVVARKEVRRYPIGHSVGALAFSPDGKNLAASYGSGMIRLWDVATGRVLPGSADPSINTLHDLRFSADGRRLFGRDTTYIAWEPTTGREMRRMVAVPDSPFTLTLSPDESLLASGDRKGTMHLWDAATGRPVRSLNVKEQEKEEEVRNSFFSADGRRLVSRGYGATIRVWDVASGRQLYQFRDDRWTAVAFSPDGRWLAAAIRQNGRSETMLWDLAAGREKMRLPSSLNTFVNEMIFSPDSRWLAAAGQGESLPSSYAIAVWEVPNGKLRHLLEGHKTQSHSVSFSSDGRMLATGGYDGTLFLWELASGRKRHQFVGHESSIYSLAFSPDGRLLAAASAEAPAYVWDVLGTTEQVRRPLSGEQLRCSLSDLASADAASAFQAIRRLTAATEQTLPFIREHMKPVSAPDPKRVRQLVATLDSEDFKERRKGAAELEKMADVAASDLRRILAKENSSLEVRRTLQRLLETRETTPEALRAVRAVEVLEWIATPEAVRLLGELAKGAADARLTHEAADARARLRR
jgi:WD40 repeat protein